VKLYLHFPNTPSWRSAKLKKHRLNFTSIEISTFLGSSSGTKFMMELQVQYGLRRIIEGGATDAHMCSCESVITAAQINTPVSVN
jgi:hypothetical protein